MNDMNSNRKEIINDFTRICNIVFKINVDANKLKIENFQCDFDKINRTIKKMYLKVEEIPNSLEYKKLYDVLGKNLVLEINNPVYNTENFITYLWLFFEEASKVLQNNEKNLIQKSLGNSTSIKPDGIIVFAFDTEEVKLIFEKIKNQLLNLIHEAGFKTISLDILKRKNHDELYEVLEQQKDENFKNGVYDKTENEEELEYSLTFKNNHYKYFQRTISEINSTEDINLKEKVIVRGTIFGEIVSKSVKNGALMFSFNITDFKDAISFFCFAREEKYIQEFKKLETGKTYEFKGTTQYKSFSNIHEWNIQLNSFVEIEPLFSLKKDKSKKPRIEFNVKSNMTTLDGFRKAKTLAHDIKEMGLKGMALMDIDSVQNFPEFNKFSANFAEFSKFYGCTFTTVKKLNNVILLEGKYNEKIDDNEFIVLDIETTGLSPIISEIIEFGASVVKNNEIIDKIQFFIKSSKPISEETTSLTGITNDMLEELGYTQEEGIKKIYDVIKDKVAVAHNASFDMNVIIQKFEEFNLNNCNTTFIDTLALSRIMHPSFNKYTLGSVAKKLSVPYNTREAHRGDYDAEVLAKIWIILKRQLSINKNITTIKELKNLNHPGEIPKYLTSKVSVLAKNKVGLKELYKLVSSAHTKLIANNSSKYPLIFFDEIKKCKNVLIGSSTLQSDLYECLFFKSLFALRQEMQKYDYIEITPPHNFASFEDKFSKDEITRLLKVLVREAKKMNKLIIAVSDARYIYPHEQEIHKVLIHASGVGGVKHYLYNYKRAQEGTLTYPLQFVPTTDEMINYFNFLNDPDLIYDIVVNNTYKLANQISEINIFEDKLFTPKFDNSETNLKDLVYENAHIKYGEVLPKIIEERIEREINPILKYGFSVIYWIASKLVTKTLNDGYLAGSRGSVGSSLVATLAGITEINPLAPHYLCNKCKYFEVIENNNFTSGFDLPNKLCPKCNIELYKDGQLIPFETFLGFNANKVPDIDLNFPGEYQCIIHNEVRRMFGKNHTFRAGTIMTAKLKTCYGYVKTYSQEIKKEFTSGFTKYLSSSIEGSKRTSGQHAGGIMIIPKEYDVEDFTPINFPSDDPESEWKTTHFNHESIHESLLKLDLLGHKDPSAIKMLERLTKIKFSDIPNMDEKVLSLFRTNEALNIKPGTIGNDTTGAIGIPEFGTPFVRQMLQEVQVESFADLISVAGLSHGTNVWLNNAQKLIREENKKIKDIISCRDDVMIYLIRKGVEPLTAFQIMENVRKKNTNVTKEQEEILIKHKIPNWYIESMKKIEYMFPKAHAAAYVLMGWRVAWFKLYKPLEHYATYFTVRCEEFDIKTMCKGKEAIEKKYNKLLEKKNSKESDIKPKEENILVSLEVAYEMVLRGFSFSNVSLKKSAATEWLIDYKNNKLIPPFITVEGLGETVAISIVNARNEYPFSSKEDLLKRTQINKNVFNDLNSLGVLDGLNDSEQINLFDE